MKTSILVDVRKLHDSGIGTYIRNLVPPVIRAFPEVRFYLLGPADQIRAWPGAAAPNAVVLDCSSPPLSIREQVDIQRRIPRGLSLYWAPHFNIPLLYRGRLLVTVHDAFPLALPDLAGSAQLRGYARIMFAAIRRRAGCVLTDSQFTRGELERLAGFAPERIAPTPLGVDPFWFGEVGGPPPHARPYVIFVGNVKPNKNLVTLLRAFQRLRDRVPHDLLIVGKKEGFITGDEAVRTEAEALGDRVQFTGFVSQEMLRRFYAHADAFVFPSLYEGFGLPPLEAMACGCPAVVSRAASLPEICGDAALYFDPRDPRDMAAAIERGLTDPGLRDALRLRGRKRAAEFGWETCARQTCDVIQALISAPAKLASRTENFSVTQEAA